MPRTVILGRRTRAEVVAAGNTPTDDETVAALADVADEHRPDGGYGDTLWRASDRTVMWIPADWTSTDEADAVGAALAAVPGVEHVVIGDAEQALPDDPEWEVVWSSSAQGVRDTATLVREYRDLAYVDLAVQQVQDELGSRQREPIDAAALLAAVPTLPEIPGLDPETLTAALAALERSHRATVEGAVALVASAVRDRGETNGDALALRAIDALRAIAARPDPAVPHVTVNVPEQNVTVPAPQVTVNVPEQNVTVPSPVVNVQTPPVHVDFHVPDPAPARAQEIHVHVPEQPAPVVNVTAAAALPPRAVRVEFDPDGNKRFVAEEYAGDDGE